MKKILMTFLFLLPGLTVLAADDMPTTDRSELAEPPGKPDKMGAIVKPPTLKEAKQKCLTEAKTNGQNLSDKELIACVRQKTGNIK
jgi:hypothetical protein